MKTFLVMGCVVLGLGTFSDAQVFRRGDVNADAVVDLGDAITALGHLFGSQAIPCADAADTNDDGHLDVGDPITLLSFLFTSGPTPPPPFPSCGSDPTPDLLGCIAPPDPCPRPIPFADPVELVPLNPGFPDGLPAIDALAAADVDGDGSIDLLVGGDASFPGAGTSLHWIPGYGDGTFGARVEIEWTLTPPQTRSIATGDLDNDGDVDIVTNAGLYLGNGDGTFQVLPAPGGGPVDLADFDQDGSLDLVSVRPSGIGVRLGNGDGTFAVETILPASSSLSGGEAGIAARDLNLDGMVDIVAGQSGISAFLGNGDGTFGSEVFTPAPMGQRSLVLGNVDLDGLLDAVLSDPGSNRSFARSSNGDGSFGPSTICDWGLGGRAVVIGDIDLDGRPDLVSDALSLLAEYALGTGDGTFDPAVAVPFGSELSSLPLGLRPLLVDVDDDGDLDLVVGGGDFFAGGHVISFENTTR
ncbi:MAG: VCBS repeat-containing protein [Planctomycetes bacterium]|nr:VCBS repeat-containing protein [Planctomycetota bacterium]